MIAHSPSHQRGALSLAMALIILVALSLITLAGARIALVEHRIAGNSVRADAAFAAAEAGLNATLAYLKVNAATFNSAASGGWRNSGSALKWQDCSGTTAPCGDGTTALYGSGWKFYGPVPNLPALSGEYRYTAWLLSNTLDTTPANRPWVGCLNLGLTALLPAATGLAIGAVNSLLSLIGPGLGLPVNLCLPINFSQVGDASPPSKINPTLYAVAEATSNADTAGAIARARVALQRTSLFAHAPPATLMVKGTSSLTGDIRIWGNPRPPTIAPNDFSFLQLNDVAGLNITSLLGTYVSSNTASLAPLLNLTVAEVLALGVDVTFPLSIWSSNTVTFNANGVGLNILNGARTCLPQWGGAHNSPCTPLSESINIPANSIALLVPSPLGAINLPLKLPDVQDPSNLVTAVGGLLGTTPVPTFPTDLMNYTFGYLSSQAAALKATATLLNNCSSLNNDSVGLYWVTGDCQLNGNIGKPGEPAVIVTEGNVNFPANAVVNAVVYMQGGGSKTITGTTSPNRPTLRGAILVDGNLTSNSGVYNLVYDYDNIRAAGFLAGSFAPLPGSWSDTWSAP